MSMAVGTGAETEVLPSVTVLMPIRNEIRFIESSLGAVLAQNYPSDRLEILVVDGMSDDGTREQVKQLLAGWDSARLIDNPRHIVSTAVNIGLQQAQGRVIILVGGHTIVEPDYVRNCITALEDTGAECVGGVVHHSSETPTAEAVALAQSTAFGTGPVPFRTGCARRREVDTAAFGAYHRRAFELAGQFDEEMVRNQDDEFNYRLRAAGGHIWVDPGIRSTYYSRSTWGSLWRQYYQYGLWKVRVFQKVPGSAQWRHLVPPLFVLSLFGGLLVAVAIPVMRPLYLLGLALYATANLAVSVRVSARAGWRYLVRLPLAFAILHLAYGLGFWAGVGRFGWPFWPSRPRGAT